MIQYPRPVDRDEIIRVLKAFEAAELEYVLIGATAMGFHGLVRATEDVDLIVLTTSGPKISLETTLPSGITRRLATCISTC